MKVLLANKYFFPKGGAENSFFETARLLEAKGHGVSFFSMAHPKNLPSPYSKYFVSNVEFLGEQGALDKLRAAGRIIYSFEARRKIRRLIEDERPDIAHLNNIYHQISPSIIDELNRAGIPMVMTLRDFKMTCPAYSHLTNGRVCEECAGGKYYRAVAKKCVKGSRFKSILCAFEMYLHHDVMRVYGKVGAFISPSRFLRDKIRSLGFDAKIHHLSNFANFDAWAPAADGAGPSAPKAVYFGRLSYEKGLFTLLDAAKAAGNLHVSIIGEGPLDKALREKAEKEKIKNVTFEGRISGQALVDAIRGASFVVAPSECYENNPRSVIEAFALAKPAIGAAIGGIPELVRDNETGYTFEPGNAIDLAKKMTALAKDPDLASAMGRAAREFVERECSPERHYEGLMDIYSSVIGKGARRVS